MDESPTLVRRVRAALRPAHDAIETTPFAQALAQGRVPLARYVDYLVQLHAVHLVAETAVVASRRTARFVRPGMRRLRALERDLRFWTGADLPPRRRHASTGSLVRRLAAYEVDKPLALVGTLYVLEGSRAGSRVLHPSLARGLGLTTDAAHGLAYHAENAAQRAARWRAFTARLDAELVGDTECSDVVEGATATMKGLHAVFDELGEALHPTRAPERAPR